MNKRSGYHPSGLWLNSLVLSSTLPIQGCFRYLGDLKMITCCRDFTDLFRLRRESRRQIRTPPKPLSSFLQHISSRNVGINMIYMISASKAGLAISSLSFLAVIADMFVLCCALQRKSEDDGFQLGRERIRSQFRPSEESDNGPRFQ